MKVKDIEHLDQGQQLHKWFRFENNGWRLQLCFIRKTNPKIKRSLGTIWYLLPNEEEHFRSLEVTINDKKPGKYNTGNRPYIICINAAGTFKSTEILQRVLYGTDGSYLHFDENSPDCFFIRKGNPINTNISGILMFKNFSISNLENLEYSLFPNPYARNPIPLDLIYTPINDLNILNNEYIIERKMCMKDIFTLLGIDKELYRDAYVKKPF